MTAISFRTRKAVGKVPDLLSAPSKIHGDEQSEQSYQQRFALDFSKYASQRSPLPPAKRRLKRASRGAGGSPSRAAEVTVASPLSRDLLSTGAAPMEARRPSCEATGADAAAEHVRHSTPIPPVLPEVFVDETTSASVAAAQQCLPAENGLANAESYGN